MRRAGKGGEGTVEIYRERPGGQEGRRLPESSDMSRVCIMAKREERGIQPARPTKTGIRHISTRQKGS